MPELLHEVPSDEELQAYCDEHFVRSVFYLNRESRPALEKVYPADIVVAIESLGCEPFCQRAMKSIFESLRRMNRLPRNDSFWRNTNNRPTIYKVSDFCRRILAADPDDVLSLWTLGSIAVWGCGNRFGQEYWTRLYRLGQLDLTSALSAALLIQIAASGTAVPFAEFLKESGAAAHATPILTEVRERGSQFLSDWVDRVREACARTLPAWLRTPADWEEFGDGRRNVLFLYVEWSAYATRGRRMVEEAARRWANEYVRWPVWWWMVDVSAGTSPVAAMTEWLSDQQQAIELSAEQLINGGAGPLIWVEQGMVAGFARAASQTGIDGLVERTREVFGVECTLK